MFEFTDQLREGKSSVLMTLPPGLLLVYLLGALLALAFLSMNFLSCSNLLSTPSSGCERQYSTLSYSYLMVLSRSQTEVGGRSLALSKDFWTKQSWVNFLVGSCSSSGQFCLRGCLGVSSSSSLRAFLDWMIWTPFSLAHAPFLSSSWRFTAFFSTWAVCWLLAEGYRRLQYSMRNEQLSISFWLRFSFFLSSRSGLPSSLFSPSFLGSTPFSLNFCLFLSAFSASHSSLFSSCTLVAQVIHLIFSCSYSYSFSLSAKSFSACAISSLRSQIFCLRSFFSWQRVRAASLCSSSSARVFISWMNWVRSSRMHSIFQLTQSRLERSSAFSTRSFQISDLSWSPTASASAIWGVLSTLAGSGTG